MQSHKIMCLPRVYFRDPIRRTNLSGYDSILTSLVGLVVTTVFQPDPLSLGVQFNAPTEGFDLDTFEKWHGFENKN